MEPFSSGPASGDAEEEGMKMQPHLTLRPTMTGSSASLPLTALLGMLEQAGATGILRTAGAELRLAAGQLVRATGAATPAATLAALMRADAQPAGLAWSFRATAGRPTGAFSLPLNALMLAAATELDHAQRDEVA
jgi:hypothetical protein